MMRRIPGLGRPRRLLPARTRSRPAIEALEARSLLALTLQVLHASDLEGGVDAIDDAPNFAAIVQGLEADATSRGIESILLSAGDNYIPGPFFSAAGDPSVRSALRAALGLPDAVEAVGRIDAAIMNVLGFDASALGNHEFDAGTGAVAGIIGPDIRDTDADGVLDQARWLGTQFPYLSANLDFSGDGNLARYHTSEILVNTAFRGSLGDLGAAASAPKLAPATIIERGGERIGVVGATTPLLEQISSPGATKVKGPGAGTEDMAALASILQPTIDGLRDLGINKIVLVSHLQQIQLEQDLIPRLRGVDISIAGGSDTLLADATDPLRPGDEADGPYPIQTAGLDGNPALIVSTDGEYSYVGRLVVTFDDAGILATDASGRVIVDPDLSGVYASTDATVAGLWDSADAAFAAGTKGARVRQLTDAVQAVVIAKDAQIFGETTVYLNGLRQDVRTQETNLGNLTADANLAAGRAIDPTVVVSIKNGGGIRDSIGEVVGDTGERRPPQANPLSGKLEGEISQLDVENSLRFNNTLSLVTVTAAELLQVIEHAVAASGPGATPGQFPQVGGLAFSFDPARPAGDRVLSLAIKDQEGDTIDEIARGGTVVGDPTRPIRVVTLGFLADGGDSYPFPALLADREDLGIGEQEALTDYLAANYATVPYSEADTDPQQDRRIQDLSLRDDAVFDPVTLPASGIRLSEIGRLTGLGAEISAYDPVSRRIFVTGAGLDIVDISDPDNPVLIDTIDLSAFGGNVTSVAVKNGIVAVAVIADTSTDPGRVVFLDSDGSLLGSVVVGSLPDMLTFTPDGTKVLVANEGEAAGDVDPEGTVSLITLASDRASLGSSTVQTVGFSSFNGQQAALVAAGLRVFAATPTLAQNLEPEYIAVSPDGLTAWVTLQENNAVAVVDIASATVTSILPLGVKDHGSDLAFLETFDFNNLPALGTTAAGQQINLGGFSGLFYEGTNPVNGNLRFITHTDRGPNAEPVDVDGDGRNERPFPLPDFQPELVRFELDRATGSLTITQRIGLTKADGTPLTGLSNLRPVDDDNAPYSDEEPVDLFGNPLPYDPFGADLEGIAVAPDGTFWMADEYRPAIYHFDAQGTLIERFVPEGTAAASGQPAGTFGTESLPAVLGQRRGNRGFEGIALQDGKVYAFVQSSIRNPASLSNSNLNGLRNVRIVEFDPGTGLTREFLYIQDLGSDKIGDAASLGGGEFLVVERDDDSIFTPGGPAIDKKVYRIDLAGATEISGLETIDGKTVDQMTPAELAAAGIVPVSKTLRVDLAAAGYNRVEKVEGLALIDADTIAVINDDDFGLEGTFDQSTGLLTVNPSPEPIVLGLISFQSNGLDASDRDDAINIRNWPVFGIFMPDGIASFESGGQTYYVTANEGDARGEEIRIGAGGYVLDPGAFPDADTLKLPENLGRLEASSIDGDTDGDGDIDRIHVYGGRSFSIRDATGKLVFDSGDQFERLTARLTPEFFNANDGDPGEFDTRSDNKGPEPEGVVLGIVNGRTYAFIGLERAGGGVMVYDITSPANPTFVQYIRTEGDIAPEGLVFIAAADSPDGRPLLVVSNEDSRSVTIYRIQSVPVINEFVFNHAGTDTNEYVEVLGNPDTDYSRFSLVQIEGDGNGAGVVDSVQRLSRTDADGYWTTGFLTDTFENGTVTLLLVEDFTGGVGDDLDADNDGTFETTPWSSLVDSVAVSDGGSADRTYSPTVLTPSYDGLPFAPGGASRIPDGIDTDSSSDWVRNDFDLEGIPGFGGTPVVGEALNTPGAANRAFAPLGSVVAPIHDIQGASHTSPLLNHEVTTTGIVTVRRSDGFYIQDPNPDADVATSEAIFVFTGTAPSASLAVGTSVRVTGIVHEAGFPNELKTTRITADMSGIAVLSEGNALPEATVIGVGGRVPPGQVIEDDAFTSFDPETDGIDFYESLEGMLVRVNSAVVVGPTNDFGEIVVLADDGASAGDRTDRGGIVIRPGDFNPERIIIDDTLVADEPQVNVGDRFDAPITGVLDYSFGNFKLFNTSALPAVTSGTLPREVTSLVATKDQLTTATFNVENLAATDPDAKFQALAALIVDNLGSPDILALDEIQDNDGATNDGVVDASQTFAKLIAAIRAAGGPSYEFRQINPEDGQDGGQPGGNIRVGFLYNPARVSFVDRVGGTSTSSTGVVDGEAGPELSSSPGRVDPTNPAFQDSRKPLAAEFLFNGQKVFVIANHFNSKGGDTSLFGEAQPPVLVSEAQRLQQAQVLNSFIDEILARDPGANIIALGDFNDFQFSAPIQVLKGGVLTDLIDSLPIGEQYTYVFDGNSQVLDHILVSQALAVNARPEVDVVHVNAEYAAGSRTSDHDPVVARFSIPERFTESVRFATFNASLNRNSEGQLVADLSTTTNDQARAVAEVIQRTNPDVVLVNEFDFDPTGAPARLFQQNYLSIGQNGAAPVYYPYVYYAPSNTGIPSGFDLNNNGTVGGPDDALGFGFFPGQFGMVLFSKFEIVQEDVRTFQTFLWKDMPGALLPDDPSTPEPNDFYSEEELAVFRLSSKSHWDVPIRINGEVVHVLASHPTPPVFDGPEDRNGTRNHDEIRLWADYITPGAGDYLYDDAGNFGGLPEGARFVIMGDQNADPLDGDSTAGAIQQLLDNPLVNTSVTPASPGGVEQAILQGGANENHLGNPAFDTADFADGAPGNLRADYVLPSQDLEIVDAGVFWPTSDDPLFRLVGTFPFPTSDHRLVYVDVAGVGSPSATRSRTIDDGTFGVQTLGQGWSTVTGSGYQGDYRAHAGDGSASTGARWFVPRTGAGRFELFATWVADASNASNATYKIYDGSTLLGTVVLDQREHPNDVSEDGTAWESLGVYSASSTGVFRIELGGVADGRVVADGVFLTSTLPAQVILGLEPPTPPAGTRRDRGRWGRGDSPAIEVTTTVLNTTTQATDPASGAGSPPDIVATVDELPSIVHPAPVSGVASTPTATGVDHVFTVAETMNADVLGGLKRVKERRKARGRIALRRAVAGRRGVALTASAAGLMGPKDVGGR